MFDHRKVVVQILTTKREKDEDEEESDHAVFVQGLCKGCKDEWQMMRKGILVSGSVITAIFLVLLVWMMLKRYYYNRSRGGHRNDVELESETEQEQEQEQGHPIWYINTVGLPQSLIDSIAVFHYTKDSGLIEGTECSVCLSELEEDDAVRLLPKCSHGFHVKCIDTWLRSHKNCPLCRAPVGLDSNNNTNNIVIVHNEEDAAESSTSTSTTSPSNHNINISSQSNSKRNHYLTTNIKRSFSMSTTSSSSSLITSKHTRTKSSILPS